MELSAAIHLLGDILGEVIGELESPELFDTEERIRAAAKERRGGSVEAAKQLEAKSGEVGRARGVADYIAGMTDRYAIVEHERLFDPAKRS